MIDPARAMGQLWGQTLESHPVVRKHGGAGSLARLRSAYANDFLGFCKLLAVIPKKPGAGPVPFVPNPVQVKYSRARTSRDVILKARQIGMTTIEQARDVWFFLVRPSASVKVVCQSSTDHAPKNALSKRFDVMFAALQRHGYRIRFEAEAVGRWKLSEDDGAAVLEIVEAGASAAAAEKKGRGDTVHRLHVTELAFFEYAGKTLNALLECVPAPDDGSEVVFESTPNGMGGDERSDTSDAAGGPYFFWQCQDARRRASGYAFHFISWMDVPEYKTALEPGEVIEPTTDRERQVAAQGATPEQLKWYRQKVAQKGQDDTDQEYPSDPDTCFLVSGRKFFDHVRTEALFAACAEPIITREVREPGAIGAIRIWHHPQPGAAYVIPVDTSEGTGGDAGSALVYERGTGRHCATLWGQFKPGELAKHAALIGWEYNIALIAVERNNHGHACLLALALVDNPQAKVRGYPLIFHDLDGKPGWNSTEISRTYALDMLEAAHRQGQWNTHDRNIVGEMRTFIVNKKGKAEAAGGAHDDLVIPAAIGWDVLARTQVEQQGPPPQAHTRDPGGPVVYPWESEGTGWG